MLEHQQVERVEAWVPACLPLLFIVVVTVHCFIGIPLSATWRRSRNLASASFVHAAIDAVRNVTLLGL